LHSFLKIIIIRGSANTYSYILIPMLCWTRRNLTSCYPHTLICQTGLNYSRHRGNYSKYYCQHQNYYSNPKSVPLQRIPAVCPDLRHPTGGEWRIWCSSSSLSLQWLNSARFEGLLSSNGPSRWKVWSCSCCSMKDSVRGSEWGNRRLRDSSVSFNTVFGRNDL
jgi:hypothetical protein